MDPVGRLSELVVAAARPGSAYVVAIAGPVAVGKSTIAAALAEAIEAAGRTVAIVPTDGFLHPNAELERRGLLGEKGAPATYDLDRLDRLVADARAGVSPLEAPVYSHVRYDVEDEPWRFERPDVLVVEGVVALQRPFGDVGVYVDADPAVVEGWYVRRFRQLVEEAADDPTSFYRGWVDLGPDEVEELARQVWRMVNLPNLVQHIEPTRPRADVVLAKGPDHTVEADLPSALPQP